MSRGEFTESTQGNVLTFARPEIQQRVTAPHVLKGIIQDAIRGKGFTVHVGDLPPMLKPHTADQVKREAEETLRNLGFPVAQEADSSILPSLYLYLATDDTNKGLLSYVAVVQVMQLLCTPCEVDGPPSAIAAVTWQDLIFGSVRPDQPARLRDALTEVFHGFLDDLREVGEGTEDAIETR